MLHNDNYSDSISGSPTNRSSRWHWDGVNVEEVHTLTCTHTVCTLTFPPWHKRTHVHTRGGGAGRGVVTGGLAGALKVNILSEEHFKFRADDQTRVELRGSWRQQMQTIFWHRESFSGAGISSMKVRRRAEINTTAWYHHLTDGGSYHGPDEARKTLGYYRAAFSAQLSPL